MTWMRNVIQFMTATMLVASMTVGIGCDGNADGYDDPDESTGPSGIAEDRRSELVEPLVGRWTGRAVADDESTEISLTFVQTGAGFTAALDLPKMDVFGWPASSVRRREAGRVEVVIPSDTGPQPMLLSFESDALVGVWQMPGWEKRASVRLQRISAPQPQSHKEVPIRFANGDISLAGTIRLPTGSGPFPGVVFVHGSGGLSRHAYQSDAIAFADRGIASLAYDKRGVGESHGDYRTADYHQLAADASAAAAALAQHVKVAPDRVGFLGTSQGGWVAPLAGNEWPAAFVIVVSGVVVSPAQEDKWDVVRRLRLAGFDSDAEAEAVFVMREWDQGLRTGDWNRFRAARRSAESKPWFRASGMHSQATFHTNISPEYADWYRRFIDYDPIPTLESLKVPVLYVLAREDEHVNAMETYEILHRRFVRPGGNVRTILFEGYDHSIRRLNERGERMRWPTRPDGYIDQLAKFVHAAKP